MKNRLKALHDCGQSVWLDYIHRDLIASGKLEKLVKEDGLKGVTSNPSIFQKAIGGNDYDASMQKILQVDPKTDSCSIYERLALADIRMAADVLREVYNKTGGQDGFVSLEVSPDLARDAEATVEQAKRLWKQVDRPNLMIKVPATPEGIPAVETLLAEGINVNVTLIFSSRQYQDVAYAYLRGLEQCQQKDKVASVASFFVSRVDSAVDRILEEINTPESLALRGKIAVDNSKAAYMEFKRIFYGEPFARLREQGARVQRPLWASTSAKNPSYSDVLYVEELVGPDTVNTIPPATMDAFRDHGKARSVLEENTIETKNRLERLAALNIDLNAIGDQLQEDGVKAFADAFSKLITALEKKRTNLIK